MAPSPSQDGTQSTFEFIQPVPCVVNHRLLSWVVCVVRRGASQHSLRCPFSRHALTVPSGREALAAPYRTDCIFCYYCVTVCLSVQARPFDGAIVRQLQESPVLMNLARAVAFHNATLQDAPLPPAEAAAQKEVADDLTEVLRTIMCL